MNPKPLVFESLQSFSKHRKSLGVEKAIGFVPTMGALHQGHADLLRRSVSENDLTVLSVFVNPTQFNDSEDFKNYPKTWDSDLAIATKAGVDIVVTPSYEQIYPDSFRFKLIENEFSKILCGLNRPGHFDGVLTIVMRLLQIVRPDRAYFGEKDYQQLQLIKDMVNSFFVPVEIVSCSTVREDSGLAMSSRNSRLSKEGRIKASLIYKFATDCENAQAAKAKLMESGFAIDYVEDINARRFVAVHLEGVRLIDNVKL